MNSHPSDNANQTDKRVYERVSLLLTLMYSVATTALFALLFDLSRGHEALSHFGGKCLYDPTYHEIFSSSLYLDIQPAQEIITTLEKKKADPPPLSLTPLFVSGPSDNRVDLVFFADGCMLFQCCRPRQH